MTGTLECAFDKDYNVQMYSRVVQCTDATLKDTNLHYIVSSPVKVAKESKLGYHFRLIKLAKLKVSTYKMLGRM